MIHRTGKSRQFGLTLPELLVSLLIFSMISGAGVVALRLAIEGREQIQIADERVRKWQVARTIIREDLAQIALRTVRDEFGDPLPGPFVGGATLRQARLQERANERPLVAFVRRGYANLDDVQPRSTLQYVEYLARGEDLIRRTRPYLDAAPGHVVRDHLILDDLNDVDMTFLIGQNSRGLEWADLWPKPGGGNAAPQAVQLSVEVDRFGRLDMLFWVDGA